MDESTSQGDRSKVENQSKYMPVYDESEEAVQATNDDAQLSKASCSALGYFEDDFVRYFVKKAGRRAPLINRGYYARRKCIVELLEGFREKCKQAGQPCQVLSLGAGYDTSYFQFKKEGVVHAKYVELDFVEVTQRKCMTIATKAALRDTLESGNPTVISGNKGTIASAQFHLLPADLRRIDQVEDAIQQSGLDLSKPTFILAECVLVYMASAESQALLQWLGETFTSALCLVYEQINPGSRFGQQMVKNLAQRGAPLKGLEATPTLQAQEARFCEHGWARAIAKDLNTVYQRHIDPVDRARIERLEMFDEFEEWQMIMGHYCIVLALTEAMDSFLGDFNFVQYDVAPQKVLAAKGLM